jgi:hypothetical protein
MSAPRPKCIGIIGRLFGHVFNKRKWEHEGLPWCYRCGYVPQVER